MPGPEDRIAVIGLAGRFPGAPSADALFRLLEEGREAISFFSEEELLEAGVPTSLLADPHYVRARGALEGAELFDAGFFALTPREASLLDPQQRLFLEQCWAALEDAGHARERGRGRTGVFASASRSTYQIHLLQRLGKEAFEPFALDGTLNDFMASRVSHALDLRGPSLMVQTACSSSLHAVHLACQSLLTGESDLCLAGAASITVPPRAGTLWQEGGISSPDGHCRAFDAGAAGTVGGDAVAVVVLKRLEDALRDRDRIHAVILGSAVNNDGAARVGFTAPGVEGQAAVIREALAAAGVSPREIGYVEAHGSGTALGDPIEIAALSLAFSSAVELARQGCPVGSIKPNVGHADVAAGLVGLIKTVLCLERRTLVPSINVQRPNPRIDFPSTPFFVQTRLEPFPSRGGPRKAGVSSFGMGGSNAHVILEEAPPPLERGPEPPWKLLVLSARSRPALEAMTSHLAEHLRAHPALALADVAHSLQVGRAPFPHRRTLICQTLEEAARALEARDDTRLRSARAEGRTRPLAFLYPGLGEQYPGMAAGLYAQAPAFRAELDRCAELLKPRLELDVRELLLDREAPAPARSPFRSRLRRGPDPPHPLLDDTRVAQPALLAFELSLHALFTSLGLRPDALLGHSLGEYAAAVAAGVFSREDALSLVAERARLIATLPPGGMLALSLSPREIEELGAGGISLAAVNGPRMSVVGGPEGALAALERALTERGVAWKRLSTRHALHTGEMRPIAAAFAARVAEVRRSPPKIPYLSSSTGTWIEAGEAQSPAYWADHLCRPVLFGAGLRELIADPTRILLELGPGSTLVSLALLAGQVEDGRPRTALGSLSPDRGDDFHHWLATLAELWRAGVALEWEALNPEGKPRRVPLPTYPFERSRHWVDGPAGVISGSVAPRERPRAEPERAYPSPPIEAPSIPGLAGPRNPREAAIQAAWQAAFGLARIGIHDDFFALGGHSLLALQLLYRVRRTCGVELSVRSLLEQPTIAGMAARWDEGVHALLGPSIRSRLDEGKEGAGRRAILEEYVAGQLARALGRPGEELRSNQDLRTVGLEQGLADLVIAFKRDLGHPVFAPELLRRPSVAGLTDLLLAIEEGSASLEPLGAMESSRVSARPGGAERKNPPAAFILSSARSGSTLLRVMLAGHPELFSPPELHLLMYESLREREARLPSAHFGKGLQRALLELCNRDGARAEALVRELLAEDASIPEVYGRIQELCRPRLLVDKSPSYAERIESLERAPRIFERCVFIHLVRHPLAVIESYVRNRIDGLARSPMGDPWAMGEAHWVSHNRTILAFLDGGRREAHRVRFEELVAEPERVMRGVAAALGVPYRPELLRPYDGGRMIDGVGDPNLHEHERIEPSLGEVWKQVRPPRPLGPEARALAARLGYARPGEE